MEKIVARHRFLKPPYRLKLFWKQRVAWIVAISGLTWTRDVERLRQQLCCRSLQWWSADHSTFTVSHSDGIVMSFRLKFKLPLVTVTMTVTMMAARPWTPSQSPSRLGLPVPVPRRPMPVSVLTGGSKFKFYSSESSESGSSDPASESRSD